MQRQANRLANQGRYGDSMMVHMNPTEVQVLDQMAPGGLTRNPQTGQPEAFAILGSLLASMLAKAGATAGATAAASGAAVPALTKLGTALTLGTGSPIVAGALGSGVTTAIQTGDLMEGVKAGVIGGLTGKVAGDLIGGLGLGEGAGAAAKDAAQVPSVDVGAANPVVSTPAVNMDAGTQAFMPQAAPVVSSAPTDAFTGMPQAAPVVPAPDAGGMFSGIGDTLGNMGMGDIVGPTVAGFVGDDAIAMYPGSGGDMEEEEEDPFYQEVRPSDRGIQMPGMGYDAGTSGEFDYFANPFQAIPVAKTGGHLRQFEDGGKVDEPINLTGIRGFDQVTAPPSFDFSGTDIYGPAPVNMDDFNLSRTTTNNTGADTGRSLFQQIAAQPTRRMPDLNAIGRGIYNLGGMGSLGGMSAGLDMSGLQGAIESYYPDNAGLSAFGPNPAFTAFGGRFAPDPVQVTPAAPASTPAFDTSAFNANQGTGMSNIGMGRMGGMEDFAMGGMGGMGGIGSMGGMSNVSTIPIGNRGPENVQANTGFNVGGMEDFSMGDMSGMGGMGGMGSMDFNIPMEYAPSTQDSLYDPNQMNARIPGMGMAPRFGGMF